ncbi:DUF202 domain-containing protein (plasmid) [Polaromonas sp. P1-6]|nr:DUF202 domain-containing protein [Polaromonas sp. P1-6]
MSYLEDPRFFCSGAHATAWQRTSIALIGLGFVVERFGLFMRMVAGGASLPSYHAHASLFFGVLFLLIGAAVALLSAWQFSRFLRELSHPEVPRGHIVWPGPVINIALAVAALAMSIWFVVTEWGVH